MGRWLYGPLAILSALAAAGPAAAEAPSQPQTIFITARAGRPGPVSETHHELSEADVLGARAATAADIVQLLPSANVPVNSRGEALLYLRNAGERQIAAFFDGALLNVPWDNRFDLSILPAGIIGRVTSVSGTLSPQYGVNALGSVAFFPKEASPTGEASLEARAGSQSLHAVNAFAGGRAGAASWFAGGGYLERAGDALSEDADVPFNQPSSDLRTNTDSETVHGLVRLAGSTSRASLAATLLASRTVRGIAPESDRASGARFWRYPGIATNMAIVSGRAELGSWASTTGSIWVQDFSQTIDSYTGADYRVIDSREVDKDLTYGARAIAQTAVAGWAVTGSANYLASTHRQRDIPFVAGVAPVSLPPELTYEQRATSIGLDLDRRLDNTTIELGAGADRIVYLQTGDKPGIEPFSKPVLRLGLSRPIGAGTQLRLALGRKSRMPTMRELFGTALNRFLTNPDLVPETISTAEIGVEHTRGGSHFFAVLFGQDVKDTIDQRAVGSKRQRVNLEGSRVIGVEAGGSLQLSEAWRLQGNVTASRARRKKGPTDTTDLLAEKPELLARLALDYRPPRGLSAGAALEHTGRAYSPNAAGAFEPLAVSTQFHLWASYRLSLSRPAGEPELFVRLENATDAFVEPQLGLPAPGRTLIAGVRASW